MNVNCRKIVQNYKAYLALIEIIGTLSFVSSMSGANVVLSDIDCVNPLSRSSSCGDLGELELEFELSADECFVTPDALSTGIG